MQLSKPDGEYDNDDILNIFLETVVESGVELYDHQEEAILEIFNGSNVILNTPTGSGKSMVALAMHYRALCQGRTSYYTVPIKALANEKFLSLCNALGAENVGMITGDATVNPTAPVICCTAEILSNIALREGASAKVDDVIMDEFHYYSDTERGIAWQVPILTLPQSRFLLMSATIGDTSLFTETLNNLTGVETVLVQSEQRPVPLEFDYSEIPLTEKVAELVESNKAPVYLVHFAQRACAESAQSLLSHNFCSKEEKQEISDALSEANFRSPYGKEIAKLLRHGIGIHHAGLLPKYRVLVEKLTQRGLLKVICGTDTLGVGVNVPIRSVLFTQLCKFDGSGTKILTVRDFKQIAGRAGRRGFDDIGYVIAQAPEHVIENIRLEAKAAASAKKKKFVKKKPPENGFVNWTEDTFRKLIDSPPEALKSSFNLRHNLILNTLSRRNEDGCAALKQLISDSHETEASKAKLRKRARSMFIALVRGGVLTIIPPAKRNPQPNSPKVEYHVDLQEDFTMNQALGLWLLEAIPQLDHEAPDYVLNLITLVEAIIEHPAAILKAQVNKRKAELISELKDEGIDYEERMERLELVTHPMPGKDFIYQTFNVFRAKHPWLEAENIRPKNIAREMFEDFMSFEDYIKTYKLERSEAILLRHLSEVYKVLSQTVPPNFKPEAVIEAEEYFKDHLTNVDSSLLDEWETLRNPDYVPDSLRENTAKEKPPITRDKRAFARLLRNHVFEIVKQLQHENFSSLLELISPVDTSGESWTTARFDQILDDYYLDHHNIRLDPEARNKKHLHISDQAGSRQQSITQTIVDDDNLNDWQITLVLDLDKTDESGTPHLTMDSVGPVSVTA